MSTQAVPIRPPKNIGKFVFYLKTAVLLVVGSTISLALLSQDSKIIKINTLDQSANRYQFACLNPGFIMGTVLFKNQSIGNESKLNFNYITNEMLFLNAQGDTLALANPEKTSSVIIGLDTLYYNKNSFLLKITHHSAAPNLFIQQHMQYMDKEKKGPYGTYSSSSSSNSAASFKNENQINAYLSADENLIYKLTTAFYLSDDLSAFFPATKSGFYKMYPKLITQLNSYIKTHTPSFNKKNDLLEMINYIENVRRQ
jgi:hypothetical protein